MNLIRRIVMLAALAGLAFFAAGCAAPTPEPTPTVPPPTPEPAPVLFTYLGHSGVLIVAPDGTRVISDPYTGHPVGLKDFPTDFSADMVTISHFHDDHVNLKAVQGSPRIISRPEKFTVGMVTLQGYISDHGLEKGVEGLSTGDNTIFVITIGDVKIAHLGGAGYITQPDILAAIDGAELVVVDGGGDPTHPFEKQIEQLRGAHVGAILVGHYSPDPKHLFYGSPTLDELLSRLPSDLKVVKMGSELELIPGMQEEVVAMTPLLAEP